MRKDKIIFTLRVSDVQEIAEQDLERELTKEELAQVVEKMYNYINWAEAISSAIQDLELEPKLA